MNAPSPLYPIADIRATERAADSALPPGTLMQRAGQAAALVACEMIPDPRQQASVLVVAGPGNNGGDAFEAALRLSKAGVRVNIVFHGDAARQPEDARHARMRAESAGLRFLDPADLDAIESHRWTLVVDGLYGIGLTRPIEGAQRALVEAVNRMACPVLSLDLPSGLDGDTGAVVGGGVAIYATVTLTFIADKPGLHTAAGRDHTASVRLARLDIQERDLAPARAWLNHPDLFPSLLKPRRHDSHKGSYGDVAVIGGAHGMAGAVVLAARAAAFSGAGRVYAGFLEQPPAYDSVQPELMCRLASLMDLNGMAIAIGPGLGTSRAAHDLVARALGAQGPLLLDADALNLVAQEPGLQQRLQRRWVPSVITPHPLEAGRLLGASSAEVQGDRPAAARELARRFNVIAVLKGSGTVIADPEGRIAINPSGNPALATAGSGDVLSGICGALLAQGYPAWEAALCAVWLHGRAADRLVEQGIGPIGLVAGELIPAVRIEFNRLIAEYGLARAR